MYANGKLKKSQRVIHKAYRKERIPFFSLKGKNVSANASLMSFLFFEGKKT
jgi:hypothetical protein